MPLQLLWYTLFPSIAVAAVGLGVYAIRRYVASTVDHQFARRIEDHKHELQRIAEQERFELQRRLAGASLYLQKQHDAAAEVYAAVRKAHGSVATLFMPKLLFRLDDCNEVDIRSIMATYQVLEGKQEDLLAIALSDRKRGAELLAQHIFDMRIPMARNELQGAGNSIALNAIYFSDETDSALAGFVAMSERWIGMASDRYERGLDITPPSREDCAEAIARVHSALRAELSDPPSLRVRRVLSSADTDGRRKD